MLLVIPVWSGDSSRVHKLLEWLKLLDAECLKYYDAMLHAERGVNISEFQQAFGSSFKSLTIHEYDQFGGDRAYPGPQNYAWQSAARKVSEFHVGPWFWLEADAIPVRPAWLHIIADSHKEAGKPFSGHIVNEQHMTGVGVYPSPVYPFIRSALITRAKPFDVVAGLMDGVVPAVNRINNLIQHTPDIDFHFDSRKDVDAIVSPEAVVFHRCKDGSLIDVLSKDIPRVIEIPPIISEVKASAAVSRLISYFSDKVYHVVERHKIKDQETERRVRSAFDSWVKIYDAKQAVPVHVWEPERHSGERELPYLKDVLLAGINKAKRPDDIIVFTNDDTILHADAMLKVREKLEHQNCTCSFRSNFVKGARIPELPHEIEQKCEKDYGRDLFAFRKHWLRDNWLDIPDFLLGAPEWDIVLTIMIRRSEKFISTIDNLKLSSPCEIPRGWVIHEKHAPQWNGVMLKSSENQHNIKLAAEWYVKNNLKHLNTIAKA